MNDDETLEKLYGTNIEIFHEQYNEGHFESLFHAIKLCAMCNKPMPHWAAVAFSEGWQRYKGAIPGPGDKQGKSTLGGAFGIVRSPNFKPYKQRRQTYAFLIWQFVEREKKSGYPVDEYLFERAAEYVSECDHKRFIEKVYGLVLPESERNQIRASTAKAMYYGFVKKLAT